MDNYVSLSIETHLFFARIMKEHSFFLQVGFPCKEEDWIKKADWFRTQFEDFLCRVVSIANGNVHLIVLKSGELATEFTIPAEKKTGQLTGVDFNCKLTADTSALRPGSVQPKNRELFFHVRRLNEEALHLLNGLIDLKEQILKEVEECHLFTANYPLLIRHILREAHLYRTYVQDLLNNRRPAYKDPTRTTEFWNRIMMEHACFIRGLLDPTENQLMDTADEFSCTYRELLNTACKQDYRLAEELKSASLKETLKYRKFKETGTSGILECKISSVILPLLADHVLREANHYIRLLKSE